MHLLKANVNEYSDTDLLETLEKLGVLVESVTFQPDYQQQYSRAVKVYYDHSGRIVQAELEIYEVEDAHVDDDWILGDVNEDDF